MMNSCYHDITSYSESIIIMFLLLLLSVYIIFMMSILWQWSRNEPRIGGGGGVVAGTRLYVGSGYDYCVHMPLLL